MYEELIRSCRACATGYEGNCDNCMFSGEDCYKQLHKASAEAIEAQDRHILTLQHEMMAEAESHIAEVNRLNKQVEELQKNVAYWQAQLTKSMCGETLAELEKPRWVSVTERLPELNVPCLVYNKSQPPMVGWRIDNKRFRIPESYLPDHPTHWMPLPSPPVEE